jgi:hypothetical protein
MPLPKSLRRPVRRNSTSSATGQPQRQRCRTCNNLDPRGHASSTYIDEAGKDPKAHLSLVIDALVLSKTKDVTRRGCRFCNVVIQALDAFFEKWRGARVRINVALREKATVKVSIDGERWRGEVIEIYAGSGRRSFIFIRFVPSGNIQLQQKATSSSVTKLPYTPLIDLCKTHLTSCSVARPMANTWYRASYPHKLGI